MFRDQQDPFDFPKEVLRHLPTAAAARQFLNSVKAANISMGTGTMTGWRGENKTAEAIRAFLLLRDDCDNPEDKENIKVICPGAAVHGLLDELQYLIVYRSTWLEGHLLGCLLSWMKTTVCEWYFLVEFLIPCKTS
ncbi:hypothetical protein GJAV_G00142350 [Gymnothorax javanicus]|nr:hypothetical protein GJAV_G00142350 [Gymnothorax javanicus]